MLQGTFDFGLDPSREGAWAERNVGLFFGVLLESAEACRVDRFRRAFCDEHRVEGTFRGVKRLHISLHSVGQHTHLPSRIIYAAKLAGRAAATLVPPFDVTLDTIMSFKRSKQARHPLVMLASGAGLMEMHSTLSGTMSGWGLRTRKRFKPHVTVLYGPHLVPEQAMEPIRFLVREFCFIHSEIGRSRYNIIERWPLRG